MNYVKTRSLLAALFFSLVPSAALTNMSYSPWVHEIVQKGADMEITVSIFDETTWTNHEDEPLPGLEAVYSLKRWGYSDDIELVFENRVFDPEEADEVTEYICQSWYSDMYETECGADDCADCDGDDIGDCHGFCGVAYRYQVVDTCPPPAAEVYYEMSTAPPYHLNIAEEGLGFTNSWIQDVGAECQEEQDTDTEDSDTGGTDSDGTDTNGTDPDGTDTDGIDTGETDTDNTDDLETDSQGTGCSAARVNASPQNRSLLTALLFLYCD